MTTREIQHHKETAGLNTELQVQSIDDIGPGGAYHAYIILDADNKIIGTVQFQKGGVKEAGGVNGVSNEVLLAIVQDRLECFQAGPFASGYNQQSLDAVKVALAAQAARTNDRIKRGVEGISTK